jgi:hypothetical protein
MVEAYSGLQLGAIHFDLFPTSLLLLREALKLAPFPSREPCWGLGLTVLDSIEKRYSATLATPLAPLVKGGTRKVFVASL